MIANKRDPLKPSLLERVRLGWEFYLLAAVLISVVVLAIRFHTRTSAEEPVIESAEVVTFGSYPTEGGNRSIMKIRMNNGELRDIKIASKIARGCKSGDQVIVEKRGLYIRVAPEACSAARHIRE